jgi:hypothetical protein
MFETAVLRKHGQGFVGIDAGLIAETLLFYSNIHIVAHYGVLQELLKSLGGDTLLRLIEDKHITFTYVRDDYGTATSIQSGIEFHQLIAMHPGPKKQKTADTIHTAFERVIGKSAHTRRLAKRFLDNITIKKHIQSPVIGISMVNLAQSDLNDPAYVQDAIKSSLVELVPLYKPPANFRFGILQSSGGLLIDHNIDIAEVNALFKQSFPSSDTTITPALLLTLLLEARIDLTLAAQYMAELHERCDGIDYQTEVGRAHGEAR